MFLKPLPDERDEVRIGCIEFSLAERTGELAAVVAAVEQQVCQDVAARRFEALPSAVVVDHKAIEVFAELAEVDSEGCSVGRDESGAGIPVEVRPDGAGPGRRDQPREPDLLRRDEVRTDICGRSNASSRTASIARQIKPRA